MAMSEQIQKQPELNEIATVARDITFPSYGGVLRSQDATLLSRGSSKGLRIYDEIEQDTHAYAVISKRKNAVVSREWCVEPASDKPLDVQAAELVKAQLGRLPFDQICLNLLDAILKGFAVSEVMWQPDEAVVRVSEVRPRDQRRFTFLDTGELRLLTPDAMLQGIPVPYRKFIRHTFGDKIGNPFGWGLGSRLFWPVFFKRQGISFWLAFADKFGSPTVVAKYRTGAGNEEKAVALAAARAVSQDAGIAIPENLMLEYLEAARSGSIDTYEKLCRYMDEQISEATLGETLTTNIGSVGSKAATSEHNNVRIELAKGDADQLSDTLNRTLMVWITDYNLPGARAPRIWRRFPELETEAERTRATLDKLRAERDEIISRLGYSPEPDYIERTYGPGWKRNSARPSGGLASVPSFSEPQPDLPDAYAERLRRAASPLLIQFTDQVKGLLDASQSLTDFRQKLEGLHGLELQNVGELLAEAMAAAQLGGRAEVLDEG